MEGVGKQYRGDHWGLREFSLKLGSGVLGLVGPNGAGKSTLMRILATISRPTEGRVTWDGEDIVQSPNELRAVLGYLPQDFGVYPHLNAVEFLEYITAINDARSVAIAALRQPGLPVVLREDHTQVLRMLAKRHLELTSLRTQAACRLHAVLTQLRPGGIARRLSAKQASRMLQGLRIVDPVGEQRRLTARTHLADIRRYDRDIKTNKVLISKAVAVSGTTVTDVYGVGPIVAAFLIGYTNNIGRFASADHYAAYNGTAPVEYSSGGKKRHRLSMRGNRMLNHAIHMAAVTQIRFDTPGRVYYDKKQAEGKTGKEALRALKRRISNVVYRQLLTDQSKRS